MNIYLKYFKYVMEHKINVFKVCYKKRRYWKGLIWHGILHDLSKFSPSEFKAYAENFYGDRDCRKCKSYMKCDYNQIGLGAGKWAKECADYRYKGFKDAWEHHFKVNKHHWNHWCYDWDKYYNEPFVTIDDCKLEVPNDMPEKYLMYMICDWEAMGIKFNDTPQQFYLNNYRKIELSYNSRMLLEYLLGINESMVHNYGHTLEHFVDLYDEKTFNSIFGFIQEQQNIDVYSLLKNNKEL